MPGVSKVISTSSLIWLIALIAGGWAAAIAQGSERLRERPDDPPGTPARRIPGAPPARDVTYGAFTSVQVNVDGAGANIPGDAANEPSIAVDPQFPNHIAIGWRQFDTISSNFRQAGVAFSTDGGRTWTSSGPIDPGVFRSDPVLCSDAGGTFYYNSLKVINNVFNCDVFESVDGGMTWSGPIFAYGGDKAWMTIDRTGGIGDGFIYQAWSTAANQWGNDTFNRSTDGGASFSVPSFIAGQPRWGTLDVSADGTLYIAGVDDDNYAQFYSARSYAASDTSATPVFTTAPLSMGGLLRINDLPNPGGLNGQVWIAADRSNGPTSGYLYMLASVDPAGSPNLDVHFSRSQDLGLVWSTPVRVNDDAGVLAYQWFGTMSLAPNGRIDAIWNDSRHSGVGNRSELFYSFSTDGGVTWAPNEQLSPQWDSHIGWPNQNKIGDYYHMISDDVGAHLAWAATFNGEQDVFYLRIGDYDCNGNGVGDSLDIATHASWDVNENGIPDECEPGATAVARESPPRVELHQNVPNPFNPTTLIRFDIPAGGAHVCIDVFDVQGRRVRRLVDRFQPSGSHSVRWDGRDSRGQPVSSGVYLYRLEAAGTAETRKMVLIR